ncbi:MAG: hypothetical protein NT023_17690 [Armatimonadetes bacterium]|nr:hypothetical protein [Armatimonadota bacterium]
MATTHPVAFPDKWLFRNTLVIHNARSVFLLYLQEPSDAIKPPFPTPLTNRMLCVAKQPSAQRGAKGCFVSQLLVYFTVRVVPPPV